jgi:hypothetical protein
MTPVGDRPVAVVVVNISTTERGTFEKQQAVSRQAVHESMCM